MSHIQQITLDLIPNGEMPILYASQYDAGRSFRANIVERKIPYTLDGTELISLTVRKGDGNLVTMDVANTFAGKTYIDFLSTEQMTAVSGSNFGELHLESNGESIGTLNFYLLVEPAADEGGITSESEINNLRRQVNEMVDDEMGDYLLKTEAEETYATITALETLSGVVDTKASKTYVDNVVSPKADKTYVDTELDKKADTSSLAEVATSGSYNDLTDKPTIPEQVQSDWNEADNTKPDYIKNKPNLSTVATSGSYNDLLDKPSIPAAQVNSDWNADSGVSQILNKPNLATVATSGNYDDLNNKPTIPVIDDTTEVNNKVWSSKKTFDKIVNILPTGNASGSIANFSTSLALPMEIVADVNASGGGGTPENPEPLIGVSAVNVFHRGSNLLNLSRTNIVTSATSSGSTPREFTENDIWVGITRTNVFHNDYILSYSVGSDYVTLKNNNSGYGIGFPIKCKPSTNYVTSSNSTYTIGIGFFDADGNYLSNTENATFTTPSNCYWLLLVFPTSANTERTYTNPQIEVGSTASDYHAYNGTTEVINLGGTYFGGKTEVDKNGGRRFKVTHEKKKFSDFNWYRGNMNTANTGRTFYIYFNNYPNYSGFTDMLCNSFSKNNVANWGALSLYEYTAASSAYFVICVEDYASVSAMLQDYGNVEFTALLKNPYYIDLTDGEPITALVGTNNVYADSGDIEVAYKKSIDDAIAELQALILG